MSPTIEIPEGTEQRISTPVGELAVWERGTGPTVVLRHGIFFDHHLWAAQVEALAERHRVVLVDAPGHGESGDPGRRYTLADDAAATLHVLDALGISEAALVGHSWGGMSAVRTALTAPHRVSALALIDTPLEPSGVSGRARYQALRLMVLAAGAPDWYGAQVAKAMFSEKSRAGNPALTSSLQRQLRRADRARLARAMDAVLVRPDAVLERIHALTQPVLVLAGDEDYVLPERTRRALEGRVPQATVLTIPGKHVLPLEEPGRTRELLSDFLAEAGR